MLFKPHKLKGVPRHVSNGYFLVKCPLHPMAQKSGYVPLHRLMMENELGRFLTKAEVVHHIDGERTNNNIENLQLTTRSLHGKVHKPPRKIKKCSWCKTEFLPKRKEQRYCSYSCAQLSSRRTRHPNKKKLVKLVQKYPYTTLAKLFGVTDVAIANWCKRLGIVVDFKRGYWQKTKADKQTKFLSVKKVKKLLWKYSIPELAKRLKLSEGKIRRWCKINKIKTPPPGYWRKVETLNTKQTGR